MSRIVCRPQGRTSCSNCHGAATRLRRVALTVSCGAAGVGVEVLGDQEAARPLGVAGSGSRARRARDRGAGRASGRARGRARSRGPTPGTPRAARTRGCCGPRACTIPSATSADRTSALPAGAAARTPGPSAGPGRRRRCRTGRRARRIRSASSLATSPASAKRHPPREGDAQPVADQDRFHVLAPAGPADELDLHTFELHAFELHAGDLHAPFDLHPLRIPVASDNEAPLRVTKYRRFPRRAQPGHATHA